MQGQSFKNAHTVRGIMRRIYDEDRSYWPYGLSLDNMDGGCWLVKDAATDMPAGFVGLQKRAHDGKMHGYYVIGILPEFRRRGLAKSALHKMMKEAAGEVDDFRAFIAEHNAPSVALAESAGVPYQFKSACEADPLPASFDMPATASVTQMVGASMRMEKQAMGLAARIGRFLKNPVTVGVGGAAGYDAMLQAALAHATDKPFLDTYLDKGSLPVRGLMGAINAGIFGAARHANVGKSLGENAMAQAIALPVALTKDLMLAGMPAMLKAPGLLDKAESALSRPPMTPAAPSVMPNIDIKNVMGSPWTLAAALAGLGATGYLGYRGVQALENMGSRGGRVKVTLPTRNPGDAETTLEMPIEQLNLTNALQGQLGRDFRRRLYAESKSRTGRRSTPVAQAVDAEREVEPV